MRVCYIGACGHTKQAHAYLKNRGDIEFCGIAPGSAHEAMEASFDPTIPFYSDYVTMLKENSPDLAVVSPVYGLTGQVILECAGRGVGVFAEKPVASSFEELRAVRKSVMENGIPFCAMHYLRYEPAFYRAAREVRSGIIGELRMITAQKSYRYGERPEWYGDRTLYGGTIPWVGIHAIDWIYHFSGKRFRSVRAQSFGESPEMAALCQFELEDGVMASVNLDYYRPVMAPTHGDDRVRCVGTKGILEVREKKIFLMNDVEDTVIQPTEAPELLEEFLDGRVPISPEEIFYLTEVAIAAREAADSGETVRLDG